MDVEALLWPILDCTLDPSQAINQPKLKPKLVMNAKNNPSCCSVFERLTLHHRMETPSPAR